MANLNHEIEIWTDQWDSYALLDSGKGRKLERFGDLVVVRSEPRAWWKPELPEKDWDRSVAVYEREGRGEWVFRKDLAPAAVLDFADLKVKIKFTSMSKHVGVFPEQSGQWAWIREKIRHYPQREPNVLNLFGYTGMASLAAAAAGARLTHVDGSKVAIGWAKENQTLSGLRDRPIRWILDDALKFVKREVRRGKRYDAIIMDPPAFGRGPKGQVWKVEDDLVPLLRSCQELLSTKPIFIFLTMYSIEASSLSIANLVRDTTSGLGGRIRCGELVLRQSRSEKLLPMSIFALWEGA